MSFSVAPGEFGPSGYARAPRVNPFDLAFAHFVRGHDWHPFSSRGYSVKDDGFFIDGHLIAQRKHGKVQMFLSEPRFFRYAIANAIRRVKRECDENDLHLHLCGEHEDCRQHEDLAVACWNDRQASQRHSEERGEKR